MPKISKRFEHLMWCVLLVEEFKLVLQNFFNENSFYSLDGYFEYKNEIYLHMI
jgi:hypothetical protein